MNFSFNGLLGLGGGSQFLTKSKILLVLCLSFIGGVFLGRYLHYTAMAIVAIFFILILSVNWTSKAWRVAGFAGLVLVMGLFRWNYVDTPSTLQKYYDSKRTVEGIISEEPDMREDKTLLTLSDISVDGSTRTDKILVYTERFPEYEYGDRIKFEAKIKEPKGAEVKGEFSYKDYLSRFEIGALVYSPQIELIGQHEGNFFKYYILKIKQHFISVLAEAIPEPHSSFLGGVLVGARRGMSQDLLEKFSITGTTHIIAISGYNITIIAWAVDKLLQRFGRRVSFLTSLFAIGMFVVLTGAQSSVIRAAIMGGLGLVALNIGRLYAITNALALTGVAMLVINPKIAHFDVGFQLSFLALMGLVYLSPWIEKYMPRIPKFIRVPLSATLAAQIFTLPILVYNFDRLSIVSTVTNILVLPAIPWAMGFGFFAGLGLMTIPFFGTVLAWVAWVILEYVIRVIEFSSSLPLASVDVSIPGWIIPVYYLSLFIIFMYNKYRERLAEIELWKLPQKTRSNIS